MHQLRQRTAQPPLCGTGSIHFLHHWAPGVGEAIQLVAAALSQRARWLSGAGLQTWVILKHRLGLNKLMGALAR